MSSKVRRNPGTVRASAIDNSTILVLSPGWHLRPNNGGGLIYKFTHDDSGYVGLDAAEVAALAFCDGKTSLGEIISYLSDSLSLPLMETRAIIAALVGKNKEHGPFLVPVRETSNGFTMVNAERILRELSANKPLPARARRLQVPISLLLIPTYRCATDCIYCYAERPLLPRNSSMSEERWVEILVEAGEAGIDLITFSGGDPLTYHGIDRLLAVARHYNMSYILPTKTLITKHRAGKLGELIGEYGQLQISVDTFDSDIADVMTGTLGWAERARKSILNAKNAGISVRTNTVVTPLNFPTVENLLRQLRELGVARAHLTNYYRSHYRHNDGLFLSLEQIKSLNETVNKLKRELKWPELRCNASTRDFSCIENKSAEAWEKRPSCSGGFSSLTILPNGDVVLCEQVPHNEQFVVGNVKQTSLLNIWNSQKVADFIVPERKLFTGTACADCPDFDICHRLYGRCFRDAFFNYGRVYAPSPNCPRSPAGLRMA